MKFIYEILKGKYLLEISGDSSVGIAMGYRLGYNSRQCKSFSLLCYVQTDSGAHSASYPTDTGDSSPGSKLAGASS
jgi:hypothetical protein